MGKYLTFDVGTTAIKTCLFDGSLSMLEKVGIEYDLLTEGEKVELVPDTYWETMKKAVAKIGTKHDLSDIRAVCLTTQGETMIPVDRDGKVLHNAVVWLDGRAEKQGEEVSRVLFGMGEKALFKTTGLTEMNGYSPVAKLLWFKEEAPEIYSKTDKFLLLEDYLIYRLTGRMVSERSLLTSTGWFDIRKDQYWSELLMKLGLDEEKLPEALECGEKVGYVTAEAASETGIPGTACVVTGAMDQIAAAIGGGGLKKDIVTATIGTCMTMTAEISEESAFSDDAMTVYRGYKKGQYVLLPFANTAGVVFKWLKDTIFTEYAAECKKAGKDVYTELCRMAEEVPAGAGGVTLLPHFAGSTRPRNLPQSRGIFFGLEIGTDRKALVRATLEGIGNMIRENLDMLRNLGVSVSKMQFFGGGSKDRFWNQIIADISDVTLVKPREEECGSLGAAILAACGSGDKENVEEAQGLNPVIDTITPDPSMRETYDAAYERYQKLFDAAETLFQ